jgi:hypothetical protein
MEPDHDQILLTVYFQIKWGKEKIGKNQKKEKEQNQKPAHTIRIWRVLVPD